MKPPYTPPWIFGVTNLLFGVAGAYASVAIPFLLRKAGVFLKTIAALAFVPAAYQPFWAPILNLGIRQRSWLVLCAGSGSLCLAATLLVKIQSKALSSIPISAASDGSCYPPLPRPARHRQP